MATSIDFILYVCEQVTGEYPVRYRKMFGDYMVYLNDKPLLLVCDGTVYIKKTPEIAHLMLNAETGIPYAGARERYILDIDNADLCRNVIHILEPITALPKPKKKKP
ncbi:MAG: TfoX/Sxy family protein [Clostridia bacterium]